MHPALLDAALHTVGLAAVDTRVDHDAAADDANDGNADGGSDTTVRLPFVSERRRPARGRAAAARVCVVAAGEDSFSLCAVDAGGAPLLTARRLVVPDRGRPAGGAGGRAHRDSLFAVEWRRPSLRALVRSRRVAMADFSKGACASDAAEMPGRGTRGAAKALKLIERWLEDEQQADSAWRR